MKELVKSVMTEEDLKECYMNMLDEIYGDVMIGTLTFSPSRIIEKLDPPAFRIGMNDYAESKNIKREGTTQ